MKCFGFIYKGKTYIKSTTPKGNIITVALPIYAEMKDE